MPVVRRPSPAQRPSPILFCLLCLVVAACSPTGSPGMTEDDAEESAAAPSPERAQGADAAATPDPAAGADPAPTAREARNEQVVRDFITAWSRLDPAELATYFTEDGVYHNVPAQPVEGRQNVEELIRGFTADWTETHWDVIHLVAEGDVVIAERVDHVTAGERSVDLPVVGVFEMEDGRIREWRDYFDLATYQRGLTGQ